MVSSKFSQGAEGDVPVQLTEEGGDSHFLRDNGAVVLPEHDHDAPVEYLEDGERVHTSSLPEGHVSKPVVLPADEEGGPNF